MVLRACGVTGFTSGRWANPKTSLPSGGIELRLLGSGFLAPDTYQSRN